MHMLGQLFSMLCQRTPPLGKKRSVLSTYLQLPELFHFGENAIGYCGKIIPIKMPAGRKTLDAFVNVTLRGQTASLILYDWFQSNFEWRFSSSFPFFLTRKSYNINDEQSTVSVKHWWFVVVKSMIIMSLILKGLVRSGWPATSSGHWPSTTWRRD